jgi:hypothetical protein
MQTCNTIFSIGQASTYNYSSNNNNNNNTNNMASNLALAHSAHASNLNLSPSNQNNNSTSNLNNSANQYVEIQAQFEMCVELRRFINIDLFQRGYYQIRLSIKCANKAIPTKIMVQLENQGKNLSGKLLYFPIVLAT